MKKRKEKCADEKKTSKNKNRTAERQKKERSDDDDYDEFDKECDRALDEARRKAAAAALCEFLSFLFFFGQYS